jgi:hypothetical protein
MIERDLALLLTATFPSKCQKKPSLAAGAYLNPDYQV